MGRGRGPAGAVADPRRPRQRSERLPHLRRSGRRPRRARRPRRRRRSRRPRVAGPRDRRPADRARAASDRPAGAVRPRRRAPADGPHLPRRAGGAARLPPRGAAGRARRPDRARPADRAPARRPEGPRDRARRTSRSTTPRRTRWPPRWDARSRRTRCATLNARTEGWAAAVYLAVRQSRDGAGPLRVSGGDDTIADYLRSVVRPDLGEDDLSLLMRTSILDVVEPEVAEAVAGQDHAAARLEALAHANQLIVRLGGAAAVVPLPPPPPRVPRGGARETGARVGAGAAPACRRLVRDRRARVARGRACVRRRRHRRDRPAGLALLPAHLVRRARRHPRPVAVAVRRRDARAAPDARHHGGAGGGPPRRVGDRRPDGRHHGARDPRRGAGRRHLVVRGRPGDAPGGDGTPRPGGRPCERASRGRIGAAGRSLAVHGPVHARRRPRHGRRSPGRGCGLRRRGGRGERRRAPAVLRARVAREPGDRPR